MHASQMHELCFSMHTFQIGRQTDFSDLPCTLLMHVPSCALLQVWQTEICDCLCTLLRRTSCAVFVRTVLFSYRLAYKLIFQTLLAGSSDACAVFVQACAVFVQALYCLCAGSSDACAVLHYLCRRSMVGATLLIQSFVLAPHLGLCGGALPFRTGDHSLMHAARLDCAVLLSFLSSCTVWQVWQTATQDLTALRPMWLNVHGL